MYRPQAPTPVQIERPKATKAAEYLIATIVVEDSKDESETAAVGCGGRDVVEEEGGGIENRDKGPGTYRPSKEMFASLQNPFTENLGGEGSAAVWCRRLENGEGSSYS